MVITAWQDLWSTLRVVSTMINQTLFVQHIGRNLAKNKHCNGEMTNCTVYLFTQKTEQILLCAC